ncbi:hypothetical protein HMPREF0731_3968 [Pseudoroseomonas cervicalis ATCC 49957]|uniref:Uncharacterized protein n=1 Tax=Pseudoroseomonas cervicalis ATCC 49957 TaxID=525371 RepID=D5RSA6_9PROT|nr:hypothetical protein HMPREF0731_3968 [Pseudoroseomonas cervicalis ATCC 49957]
MGATAPCPPAGAGPPCLASAALPRKCFRPPPAGAAPGVFLRRTGLGHGRLNRASTIPRHDVAGPATQALSLPIGTGPQITGAAAPPSLAGAVHSGADPPPGSAPIFLRGSRPLSQCSMGR